MKSLKKLRTSRHLSQSKLAKPFHINQQSVWKYEDDLIRPDLELIIASANCFDTSIDYLVGDMNDPRKYEALSETELNEEELAHLCLYRASTPGVRKLSE